jgi:hypothetical protein
MKDEESNNLNESKGLSPQASKKLPYRPPFVRMLESPLITTGKLRRNSYEVIAYRTPGPS